MSVNFVRRLLYCDNDCGNATRHVWEVCANDELVISCYDCGSCSYMEFIPTECSHVENTFVPILVGACDLCVDTILRRYMDQVTRHCPECGGNFTIVLSGICHRCGYDMKLCMDICNRKPSCRCYQEQRGYYEDGKPVFDCLPDFL